ncbi:MAG: ATP-binding cassette domain-containing protein [Planctomycetaceae bacterium]
MLLGMTFSGKVDRPYARSLLEQVGLSHRLNHRPGQLSVGEQQRVSVARALANRPKLMLADEPTASVDMAHQETILTLLRTACSENNVSLLLVTHSPEVSAQFERVEELTAFNKPEAAA